jgi:hypothetical protein
MSNGEVEVEVGKVYKKNSTETQETERVVYNQNFVQQSPQGTKASRWHKERQQKAGIFLTT